MNGVKDLFYGVAWVIIFALLLGGRPWIFPEGGRRVIAYLKVQSTREHAH